MAAVTRLRCPDCERPLRVSGSLRPEQDVRCPQCKSTFTAMKGGAQITATDERPGPKWSAETVELPRSMDAKSPRATRSYREWPWMVAYSLTLTALATVLFLPSAEPQKPQLVTVEEPSPPVVARKPARPKISQGVVQKSNTEKNSTPRETPWDVVGRNEGDDPLDWIRLQPAPPEGRQVGLKRGSLAPPLESVDLDGRPMRLQEFRGKTVLLIFWADWCPYCRLLYEPARFLSKQYQDQPFVVLGVSDERSQPRDKAKQVMQEHGLTFRCWGRAEGAWKANSIPRAVLIDKEGRIRYMQVGASPQTGAILTELVEQLLEEAPEAAP